MTTHKRRTAVAASYWPYEADESFHYISAIMPSIQLAVGDSGLLRHGYRDRGCRVSIKLVYPC